MSIEIDILNGDASWSQVEPLMKAVWPRHVTERLPWGHIEWAHADLRVLIDAPEGDLGCHVGIYFRTVTWNGRKVHVGGIGGVSVFPPKRIGLLIVPDAIGIHQWKKDDPSLQRFYHVGIGIGFRTVAQADGVFLREK